jgi:hypothetical protein
MAAALTIYGELSDATQEALSDLTRLCRSLGDGYLSLLEQAFAPAPPMASQERLRSKLWEMRRLLRTAIGPGLDKELALILNSLEEHSGELERAVVVWVDLIEALAQATERAYGSAPGRGSLKAADVRAAIRFLVKSERFWLPGVPTFMKPVVADVIADWTIDVVVLMANRYGLWTDVRPEPVSLRIRLVLWLRGRRRLLRPLWLPIAFLFTRIWALLERSPPPSPAVREALKAVEREGLLGNERWVLDTLGELFAWIGNHRPQVVASFELVFAAVQEAESYLTLSGPEKKAYARELVMAVLSELGWEQRTGLLFALVDSLAGTAIEASVHLFNKRGVFEHDSAVAPA